MHRAVILVSQMPLNQRRHQYIAGKLDVKSSRMYQILEEAVGKGLISKDKSHAGHAYYTPMPEGVRAAKEFLANYNPNQDTERTPKHDVYRDRMAKGREYDMYRAVLAIHSLPLGDAHCMNVAAKMNMSATFTRVILSLGVVSGLLIKSDRVGRAIVYDLAEGALDKAQHFFLKYNDDAKSQD